jgi:hypothetical protein
VEAKDMGDLLTACVDTAAIYRECKARHKALADSYKPSNLWSLFR